MRRLISAIILFFGFSIGNIISASPLDQRADSAYTAGDFSLATSLYEKELKESGSSATLYYNLGNCYYRLGKMAKAVIAYERSLRLDPANASAKVNLDFVNSKLVDKKGYEGSFISRTFSDITALMSANAWGWLSLILFCLIVAATALYLFSGNVRLRKTGFFGGGIICILFIFSIVFAFYARNMMTAKNKGVVSVPSSILSTSPRHPQNRTEEAMLLHEGARVTILDSVASPTDSLKTMWYDVAFDNDHRAWINSADVEII